MRISNNGFNKFYKGNNSLIIYSFLSLFLIVCMIMTVIFAPIILDKLNFYFKLSFICYAVICVSIIIFLIKKDFLNIEKPLIISNSPFSYNSYFSYYFLLSELQYFILFSNFKNTDISYYFTPLIICFISTFFYWIGFKSLNYKLKPQNNYFVFKRKNLLDKKLIFSSFINSLFYMSCSIIIFCIIALLSKKANIEKPTLFIKILINLNIVIFMVLSMVNFLKEIFKCTNFFVLLFFFSCFLISIIDIKNWQIVTLIVIILNLILNIRTVELVFKKLNLHNNFKSNLLEISWKITTLNIKLSSSVLLLYLIFLLDEKYKVTSKFLKMFFRIMMLDDLSSDLFIIKNFSTMFVISSIRLFIVNNVYFFVLILCNTKSFISFKSNFIITLKTHLEKKYPYDIEEKKDE